MTMLFRVDIQQDKAFEKFTKEEKKRLTNGLNFRDTIEQIRLKIGGPMAVTIQKTRVKLARGLNTEKAYEGYNMSAAKGNMMGKGVPKPSTHLGPVYTALRYKKFIHEVQARLGGHYEPANSIEFVIDTKDDISKYNFGQTTVGVNTDFNYGGWFGFSAFGNLSESSSTLDTSSHASPVKIKLLYDKTERSPSNLVLGQ
ncbi:hypothetical protein ColTof4_08890 [Colletotrichum tofieldiae]|nr:hypothetical protein ColTof3_03903 [Colletotrichum tofieldiae]GKT76467.1 hypothetical protein ColTof4_08890 [Colletotrichum tofieldiae]GKT87514.1 hypothetical protein Ct61P_05364 [Colletotrichum tofieldiae]